MYGDVAVELLKELDRTLQNGAVGPFNDDSLRKILQEIRELWQVIEEAVTTRGEELKNPALALRMTMLYTAVHRNKRCALTYIMNRMARLLELRWSYGAILPKDIQDCMSPEEMTVFSAYSKVLGEYINQVGFDLTQDLTPPKDLYIEIRCLKDLGVVQFERGAVSLSLGSQHLLRRSDVEDMIRQGDVEHVTM